METIQADPFRFAFYDGFYPDQPPIGPGTIPGTWREGEGLWQRSNEVISGFGITQGASTGGVLTQMMVVRNLQAGMTGGGNITTGFNTDWFAGPAGSQAWVNGSAIGTSAGKVNLIVGGSAVEAGLAAPSTPTFADSGTSGRLNGSYSVALGVLRSTSGALSNRSAPTAAIAVKNRKGRVTFPSIPTGATHWVIYGTEKGKGSVGDWFKAHTSLTLLPVATYNPGSTYDLDWLDGELGFAGPIDFDPSPSNVTHVAIVGGSVVALVINGLIYPSFVGRPEAYPPQYVTNLPAHETVTGINVRGVDGVTVVSTANSLSVLVAGSELTPVIARALWDIGFPTQKSWCFYLNDIYGMTGTCTPVRSQGDSAPDFSFAKPVLKYMKANGFTAANTTVVAAPNNGAILFLSGTKVLAYGLANGRWSGPFTIGTAPSNGITIGETGYLVVGNLLTTIDTGSNSNWFGLSPSQSYGGKMMTVTEVYAEGPNSHVVDLYKDLSASSLGGFLPWNFTTPHGGGEPLKMNDKCRSLAYRASGTLGGQTPAVVSVGFTVEPGRH